MADKKWWVTNIGLGELEAARAKLPAPKRPLREFADCDELKNALKQYNEKFNHSDWNHMQKAGRGIRLTQICSVLDALGLPHDPTYFTDKPEENEFTKAYSGMAHWNEFPVSIFCGGTKLADALESNVITRSDKKEEARPELNMATAGLHDVRFHRETTPEVASVLDTLAKLRNNGKLPRLLIFGEAGDGKSTLLRVLGRAYLAQDRLPVLIKAREWEDSGKSLSDFLRDSYFDDEEDDALRTGGAAIWDKVKAGNAPLLIDGLDEAQRPEEIGTKLGRVAQACRGTDGKGAEPVIVVTSRRQGYANALSDYARVELQTFDFEKQVKPYVGARLKGDADAFLTRLQDDARSRALTGNGLMLAMLCTRWEQLRKAGGSARFELPVSRGELYDWALGLLLANPKTTRRIEHTTFYDKPDMKRAILAAVAFHAQFCHQRTLTIDKRLVEKALAEVTDKDSPYASDHALRHAILNDIVLNSELLSCDESGTVYRFFHPTFQEYFAALYMVQHWDAKGWRDWLPTREGWQEWGYNDLPWPSSYEDGEAMRQHEFCCLICRNQLQPFPDMLMRTEYRETFLLMVGLLNNAQNEFSLLNGVARSFPPISGYESDTYRKGIRVRVQFDDNDALGAEMWDGDTLLEQSEWPYLEHRVFCDDLQNWLEWALQAVSRCGADHSAVVRRVLAGLTCTP